MRLLAGALVVCGWLNAAAAGETAPAEGDPDYFDWSGLYVGVYGAYGFGHARTSGSFDLNPSDPYAGVRGGISYMLERIVVGIEADISLADLDDDKGAGAGFLSMDIDNIASISGRIGVPFNRLLVFASAGWSWARSERSTLAIDARELLNGPMVGIGLQHVLSGRLTGRVEYVHQDYGKVRYGLPGTSKVDSRVDIIKLGLDFLF